MSTNKLYPSIEEINQIKNELMELAGIGVFRYTFDGTILYMDRNVAKILEVDHLYEDTNMLIGKKLSELFIYQQPEASLRNLLKEKKCIRNYEYPFKTLAGKLKYSLHDLFLLKDEQSNEYAIQVIVRDITEIEETKILLKKTNKELEMHKKQLETIVKERTKELKQEIADRKQTVDLLRVSEERYRTLIENLPQKIFLKDRNSIYISCNKSYAEDLGIESDQIDGKTDYDFFPKQLSEKYRIDDKRIMNSGEIEELQENYIKNGQEFWVNTVKIPVKDTDGNIISILGIFWDITEKKRYEEQLRQTHKLEAIGTLAGGIAHDFNNMLGVIVGNISYALSTLNKNDELYEVLSDVQESSKQAQSLTYQLLTFSKGGAPIKKVSSINQLLTESAIFSTRGAKANCKFELSDNLWTVEVDEGQINQVIGNLVINANQAMPDGGTITITTENVNIVPESSIPLPVGRYIKIVVEDQGLGISKKHLPKIFEPYFTTKQKGSGLGLATAYSIIKRHGGHITVYSEIEKGTVFNIYLPALLKGVKATEDKGESKHTGKGKILIMDDQESILKMLGRMLNHMGYRTEFAMDGSEAIKKYREAYQSQNPYHLVILDLTVPGGMGGAKTIPELLKIDPKVKAFVSSGYSNDSIMGNYKDYGFCGVVPKPYTKDQLAELLNKIFDQNTDV